MPKTKKGHGVLARFFRRKQTSTLGAELQSRAINKPLFAHAELGAQIIQGFLRQSEMTGAETDTDEPISSRSEGVAVMDISGALVSRPTGWCSPLSYEEIRDEFDELVADSNVTAIVMRMDSAGGEAAQNIDLSDHIYRNRGQKPVIAMIDDMAYSACYALAAACDEIWVTRTSGVGSVGVVSYHVDQSEMNKKHGLRIEFIHAGDRKVDFNPHEPLSDDARGRMQNEVDRLYTMFVDAVARYRSMEAQAVIDTQATTFYGETAIEAGFADTLGTFSELMAYLDGGEKPEQPTGKQSAKSPAPDKPKPAEPDQSEDYDAVPGDNDGTPGDELAADSLADAEESGVAEKQKSNQSQSQLQSQLQAEKAKQREAEIRAICTAAGVPDVASDFIASGQGAQQVREDLISLLNTGEVEVESSQRATVAEPQSSSAAIPKASEVYARRNNKGN